MKTNIEHLKHVGINQYLQNEFELITKIALCIDKPFNETNELVSTISKMVVFASHNQDHGTTNWLLSYAAQYGELPQIVDGKLIVKSRDIQDDMDIIQGVAGASIPGGVLVIRQSESVCKSWMNYEKEFVEQEAKKAKQINSPSIVTIKNSQPKTGRNDPCPCGSKKKFKNCCLNIKQEIDESVKRIRTQSRAVEIYDQGTMKCSVGHACAYAMEALEYIQNQAVSGKN